MHIAHETHGQLGGENQQDWKQIGFIQGLGFRVLENQHISHERHGHLGGENQQHGEQLHRVYIGFMV